MNGICEVHICPAYLHEGIVNNTTVIILSPTTINNTAKQLNSLHSTNTLTHLHDGYDNVTTIYPP